MITLDQKAEILLKYFRENKSQRAISKELGISRTTVQKYINDMILYKSLSYFSKMATTILTNPSFKIGILAKGVKKFLNGTSL